MHPSGGENSVPQDSRVVELEQGMSNMSLTQLTDISLEQAVARLKEIEKENIALRDNLREQNSMMKKQYENLSIWRQREKDHFEQTKALVVALRKENQEMQVKLLDKDEKWSMINPVELENHENQQTMAGVGGRVREGIDLLNIPENMEDLRNFSQEGLSPDNPKSQMDRDSAEKLRLMDQVKQLQYEVKQKAQDLEEARRDCCATVDRLNQEYEQKLMDMAQLTSEKSRTPVQTNDTQDISLLCTQNLELMKEVDEKKVQLAAAMETINKKDNRIAELETFSNNLWQQLEGHQMIQAENNTLKRQYQQLQVSYQNLEERTRSSQTLEEINRLTAQVIAADEALEQKDETINHLKHHQASLEQKAEEELLLYKYQAEMYKKDFEDEREARTRMKDEKNSVEEAMKVLEERNRALKEEMEGFNRRQILDIQHRLWTGGTMTQNVPNRLTHNDGPGRVVRPGPQWDHTMVTRTATPPNQPIEVTEEPQSFQLLECPTCNSPFPDLDSLQLHVAECIDAHG